MPRGGAREGAGRRGLSYQEQLWIFHECCRLQGLLTAIKHSIQVRQYYLSRFDRPEKGLHFRALAEAWSTMRSWSPDIRRKALADAEQDTQAGELLGDVKDHGRAIAAANSDSRFHHIALTRLKGHRSAIVKRVAGRATMHFGRRISDRQVRSIWERISAAVKKDG